MLHAVLAAATIGLLPVHGVVIDSLGDGSAIVRTEPVTGTLPSLIRRYRLEPNPHIEPGVGIDALLDRSTDPWTLRAPVTATPFAPGLPDSGRVVPVDVNAPLPAASLVDQDGRPVQLDRAFAGKTVLLSFVFTRCPDRTLCPAISGKYAYMQARLDPASFALVEITLDPPYDSPAVLRRYAVQYGARANVWTMLTGTGSEIQRVLNEFGIDSMRLSTSNYLHNDKLYIVSPQGRIANIVATAGWDPDAAIAQARAVAGLSNNGFERFRLSLIAGVVALCGGSQTAGIVLLETTMFFIIVVIVTAALWVVARILWHVKQEQ